VIVGVLAAPLLLWGVAQLAGAELEMESNIDARRAAAKLDAGDYRGALADFTLAIEKAPGHSEPYAFRGLTQFRLGDLPQAHADLDTALRNNPDNAHAHHFLGIVLWHEGKRLQAFVELSRAVQRNPSYAEAWWERANAYATVGEHQKAIPDFDRAVTLRGDANDYFSRGISKMHLGDCAAGKADAQEGLRRAPGPETKARLERAIGESRSVCP
jgi:tetratricopeptide (TPR) repeat protein